MRKPVRIAQVLHESEERVREWLNKNKGVVMIYRTIKNPAES